MAESVPVTIGGLDDTRSGDDLARILGRCAADVIGLHMSVIDREDRLESGTGDWLDSFASDPPARDAAARETVLRSLSMAADATNFAILSTLSEGVGTPIEDVQQASGLGRVPLAERLGDLVSAGLAVKIPEANQVAGTAAGAALVDLVSRAAKSASGELRSSRR